MSVRSTNTVLLLATLLLAGCDVAYDGNAKPVSSTGRTYVFYDKHCVEGVTYLIFGNRQGATALLTPDGKVVPCGK